MPYEIKKSGTKYVVKKRGKGGKVFGRHISKQKAKRQLRAIHANTNESFDSALSNVLKEVT